VFSEKNDLRPLRVEFHLFLDLLLDVVHRDASTLSSSFLLKVIGGIPPSTSVLLPLIESCVLLGMALLFTLQLVGIEL
jgi:hypothetical protein